AGDRVFSHSKSESIVNRRAISVVAVLMLSASLAPCRADDTPKKPQPAYETRREHDPNGIGKFYMGREIAMVMGHEAAGWLERPEREREEQPAKLLEALKLKEG